MITTAQMAAFAAFVALGGVRLWLTFRGRRQVAGTLRDGTTVFVRTRGRYRELVLEKDGAEMVQSRQDKDDPLSAGPGYVDGLHIGMLLDERPKRVVFLGGGACIAPRQFEVAYPGVDIDVVEKEPVVIAAASRFFGFKVTKHVAVHVADAKKFVHDLPYGTYDLVVLDCYDAAGVPPELTTAGFFTSLPGAAPAVVANLLKGSAQAAELRAAYPDCESAVFDAGDNEILLLAPHVPEQKILAARADGISVARTLPAIVKARRDDSARSAAPPAR